MVDMQTDKRVERVGINFRIQTGNGHPIKKIAKAVKVLKNVFEYPIDWDDTIMLIDGRFVYVKKLAFKK